LAGTIAASGRSGLGHLFPGALGEAAVLANAYLARQAGDAPTLAVVT
jgi:hypothetical protein